MVDTSIKISVDVLERMKVLKSVLGSSSYADMIMTIGTLITRSSETNNIPYIITIKFDNSELMNEFFSSEELAELNKVLSSIVSKFSCIVKSSMV